MKYKLLKSLPDIEAGTIIEYKNDKYFFESGSEVHREFNDIFYRIFHRDSKDWYEEVKEAKTIYDLKKGDISYFLDEWGNIKEYKLSVNEQLHTNNVTSYFSTEREAKRNKLLRELATREKWLPDKGEYYTTYGESNHNYINEWDGGNIDCINYYNGMVFRNEEEYNKWMTEENKSLLFEI